MGPESNECFMSNIDLNSLLITLDCNFFLDTFFKTHLYDVYPFPFDPGYPVPIPLADTSGSGRDRSGRGLKRMNALTAASSAVMVATITVTTEKKSS